MAQILVRATVTAEGYCAGWIGYVEDTDPVVLQLLAAGYLVTDVFVPPPPGGDPCCVPDGGALGDVLTKHSNADGDTSWAAPFRPPVGTGDIADDAVTIGKINPTGGVDGQVIGRVAGDTAWVNQSGGSGGGDPTMGGDLSGLASAAQIVAGAVGSAEVAAAIKDAAAGTASLRTLGTGSAQAAAGNHQHALDELSDVNTAGAVAGTSVLGLVGSTWVPVPGGGGAVMLADLSGDIDLTGQADGDYLGRVAGVWSPVTPPGGATTLDQLNDVDTPTPGEGDLLTFHLGEWISQPGGTGAVTWMVFPENYGATGDAFAGIAISVNAGLVNSGNPLIMTGQTFTPAMVTAGYCVIWQTPGGNAEIAQIKTRVDNTHVTLAPVGTPAGTYTAAASVSGVPGCRFNPADTIGWQSAIDAARTTGVAIGVKNNTRYGLSTSLNAENVKALFIQNLAGRGFVANPAATFPVAVANGANFYACSVAPITMLRCGSADPTTGTDAIAHNGLHLERMTFHDPTFRNVHTGCLTRYQTRCRIYDNHFANLGTGYRFESGTKDVSWAEMRDNTFINNTIGVDCYNAVWNGGLLAGDAPTGAMASTITGGNFNIMAGQTGILWRGGQYGTIANMKMDQDGANSCCIRILNGVAYAAHGAFAAGTSPSGGMITIANIRVEATGSSMSATTPVFDIQTDRVIITGCQIGGGGGIGGIGIAIGLTGSNVAASVHVTNSIIINRDVCVVFGPKATAGKIVGCRLGGSGKFVRWDTGSQDCVLAHSHCDIGSNPITDSSKLDYTTGSPTRPWITNISWNTGSCAAPVFTAAPPAAFGPNGATAYQDTAGTSRMWTKINGAWV